MNEGDQNRGERLLEELEVAAELATIIERNMLPQRIAQRIGEKIKEKNIKVTKDQLYKLVEKIQSTLRSYTSSTSSQLEQQKKAEPLILVKEEKKPWNSTTVQTTDMMKLVEAVEKLNERLKVIEENRIEGVKGVTGKLVKTKDIKTLESAEILGEDMQPLEHIPSDPESIVVIMKWLQYLVDKDREKQSS